MNNNDSIDRDALIKAIGQNPESSGNQRAAQILECILNAALVDAVPVVRCCDCKYGEFDLIDQGYLEPPACEGMLCHKHNIKMDFIGFCSYGERKEPTNGIE